MSRISLTIVMTHPVQYYAPWFRHIERHCSEIHLEVLYAIQPAPEHQGAGFDRPFTWDTPLLEGYRYRILRTARAGDNVRCDSFWGIDAPQIAHALEQTRPDIVLIPGWNSVTLVRALRACRRLGLPVLYRGDTSLASAPAGLRRSLWRAKSGVLLRQFDGYLSVGSRVNAYLRSFGIREELIFNAPHCVDDEFFAAAAEPHRTTEKRNELRASLGIPADAFAVLFAGKLQSKKRPLDVLRAAARLHRVAVMVAGSGPMERRARAEAEGLGVRFAFLGFVNQSGMGRVYAAADCLVLPSSEETWGLVVNEALATGLPCVVSDQVGCGPDLVIPRETGEVFKVGDVGDLAAALERVRERSAAGHDWAPSCRRRVAQFSLKAATDGLLAASRAVLSVNSASKLASDSMHGGEEPTRRFRLALVMTHPIQYYAPWFRYVTAHCSHIELEVIYGIQPTPELQGIGFGQPFTWDVPLTAGYKCRVLRALRPEDKVCGDGLWDIDVPEVGRALRESRPDAVLIPGWQSVTLLRALWACRKLGIPTIYRGETHIGSAPHGWKNALWRMKSRALLRQFDVYLSIGWQARRYLHKFGRCGRPIFDSPYCVDSAFFAAAAAPYQSYDARTRLRGSMGIDPEAFVALFVGKLQKKKRPLDLIRAAARIPGVVLLIAGTGALEAALRKEAERLQVRAVWLGFVNQSDLGRVYAAADCLVLPSAGTETWGLVVNEALATGLPCIVSDQVGCAADLITPGETGEVYAMGDIAALGGALRRVRQRCLDGRNWAEACRERAANYSFERATAGLLSGCQGLTARQSDPNESRSQCRVIACCGGMVTPSGLEFMTFEALRVLRQRGAEVHCVVNNWASDQIVPLAEEIGASWSIGSYRRPFTRHSKNPIKYAFLVLDILRTSAGLLRDALRFRPTHLVLPEFASVLRNAPALLILGRLFRVQVIQAVQNGPAAGQFYRKLWRYCVAPFVDRFVCCSRYVRDVLAAYGVNGDRLTVIYNTVPSSHATQLGYVQRDSNRLIYVGQIIPEKGLHLLLDALGVLASRGVDAQLDVVGSMTGWVAHRYIGYREQLIARANKPDISGRVHFLGWRTDVTDLIRRATLHCCPSTPDQGEGCPVVIVEAKAVGCPSVVFSVGPLPEVVRHKEEGWVCPEVTAEAMATGIEYFLNHPERLEQARRNALDSVEKFSRRRFADAWCSLFNLASAKNGNSRTSTAPPGSTYSETALSQMVGSQ